MTAKRIFPFLLICKDSFQEGGTHLWLEEVRGWRGRDGEGFICYIASDRVSSESARALSNRFVIANVVHGNARLLEVVFRASPSFELFIYH